MHIGHILGYTMCCNVFTRFTVFYKETITKSVAKPENDHVYSGVVCDLTVMSGTVSFALS